MSEPVSQPISPLQTHSHAIQLTMTHDPDVDIGGVGRPFVANPRGDLKTANWEDDGTDLQVLLLPTSGQTLTDMKHFKFYVAGGITNLFVPVSGVEAVDINGDPVVGVTATIQ